MNKAHKINSEDKVSLNQWLLGILFALYAWNEGTVYGTEITRSTGAISTEFPFTIDLSTSRSREDNSEGKQALYHFEDAYPLLFRQIELFNILVSEKRMRHREILNKIKSMREFDTGYLVVVSKQMK